MKYYCVICGTCTFEMTNCPKCGGRTIAQDVEIPACECGETAFNVTAFQLSQAEGVIECDCCGRSLRPSRANLILAATTCAIEGMRSGQLAFKPSAFFSELAARRDEYLNQWKAK